MANLATAWFGLADVDRDGKISGPEAVNFFMRSGLPKDVLGQVGGPGKHCSPICARFWPLLPALPAPTRSC